MTRSNLKTDEDSLAIAIDLVSDYPKLMTVEQAAEAADTSTRTVYDWIAGGYLIVLSTCRGGHTRVPREALAKCLARWIGRKVS